MKRKGNNKEPRGIRPIDNGTKIVRESLGRFREMARERIKEDMGARILRIVPYVLV